MKKYNQSVLNTLLQLLPQTKFKIKESVDPLVADSLYAIWRNGSIIDNKNKIYKRPSTLSMFDVEQMQKSGLIRVIGSNIEITQKGSKVIKVMILGDDRSSFENSDIVIDYNTALNNTKDIKTAKKTK